MKPLMFAVLENNLGKTDDFYQMLYQQNTDRAGLTNISTIAH